MVDVLALVTDEQLADLGLEKNVWGLLGADEAKRLYEAMPAGIEVSGGSAANTAIGVASLGGTSRYVGKVSDDQLGAVFVHDLRSTGVVYDTQLAAGGAPTGRCLILVTPDAHRTMRPFLGAAHELTADDVPDEAVAAAQVSYTEGFWDAECARDAFQKALRVAHGSGRQAALSLSDVVCVNNFGDDFLTLLEAGEIDVLLGNEAEVLALFPDTELEPAIERLRNLCPVAAITRGEHGSIVMAGEETQEIAAAAVGEVVDTTGAGDSYAAGFLFGLTRGDSLARCGELGSLCAGEIISHIGARPQRPLAELVAPS